MLWQKSWWETRMGFLMILGWLLVALAVNQVWKEPDLTGWASWVQHTASDWGKMQPQQDERVLALLSAWPGYVWWNWFHSLMVAWPFYAFAVTVTLTKTLCSLTGALGVPARFTFSLPVSRRKALLTHSAFVAMAAILSVLVVSLICLIAIRWSGRWYPFGSTVIYALLLSLGGVVYVAFAFLLMVIFNNSWIVMAIAIPAVFVPVSPLYLLRLRVTMLDEYPWWHIYHVMSGETYFRYGRIPWLGLLASFIVSALMMLAAARIYERRDF